MADRLAISRHTVYLYIRQNQTGQGSELCSRREKSRLWKQGAFLAYQFAQALLEKGMPLAKFSFQDGVSNGNELGLSYPMMDLISQAANLFNPASYSFAFMCSRFHNVVA